MGMEHIETGSYQWDGPVRRPGQGERSFYRGLLPFVTIQKVPEKALSGFQLDRLLLNVNTPEEWEKPL